VIGVRGVTHPQKKPYSDDGKKADHFLFFCITLMQARVAERRSAGLRARKLKNSSIPAPVLDETIKTCMPSRTDSIWAKFAVGSCSRFTEGENKPLKYPTIFNSADVTVITCMLVRTAASSNSTAGGQVHLG